MDAALVEGTAARKRSGYNIITIEATKKPEDVKLRVAAYARVSSDSEDQENSLAAQTRYYTSQITEKPQWEMVDIYADDGISGTSMEKRADFLRLMKDCRRGLIDKILVKSISRFARNTTECLESVRELQAMGISVYFEKENIDTGRISSEMMLTIFASFAQQESESISGNMTWAWQKRMENGTFIPSSQPYGYCVIDGQIVVDELRAKHIRTIFSLYLSGMSTLDIAHYMAEQSKVAPELREIKWTYKGVTRILKNEKYTGNSLWQKRITTESFPHKKVKNRGERQQYYAEGTHPPIIDQETFDRTQALMCKQNRHKTPSTEANSSVFKGSMICEHCGCLLRRKTIRGVGYRTCRSRDDKNTECTLLPVRESDVEILFCRMYYKLKHYPILSQMLADLRKAAENRLLWREDVVALNKKISDIASQEQMLASLKKQGLIDPDIFIAQSNALARQLREIKRQKERILDSDSDDTIARTQDMVEVLDNGPDFIERIEPELYHGLVEQIKVGDNDHFVIQLKNGLELPETLTQEEA